MKKFVFILVIIISFFFINGCKNKDDNEEYNNDEAAYVEYLAKSLDYETKLNNATDITIELNTTINKHSENVTIKAFKEEKTIEIISGSHRLYKIEDDKIFEYYILGPKCIKKPYVIEENSEYNIEELLNDDYTENKLYQNDFSNIQIRNFRLINTTYYFEVSLAEFLLNSNNDQLNQLIDELKKENTNILLDLNDTLLRFEISINKDAYLMTMLFTLKATVNDISISIPFNIKTAIKYNQNDMTDVSKLEDLGPQKIEDVWEYTNLSESLIVQPNENHYGMFNIDKGLYYLDILGDSASIYFLDKEKNSIDPCFELFQGNNGNGGQYFNFEYDGLYYYRLYSGYIEETKIKLIKLDTSFEEIYNFNPFVSGDFKLSDKYDIKFFETENPGISTYKIKNNSEIDLKIIFVNYDQDRKVIRQSEEKIINSNSTGYIYSLEGTNYFAIMNLNQTDDIEEVAIDIEVEKYDTIEGYDSLVEDKCLFIRANSYKHYYLELSETKLLDLEFENAYFEFSFSNSSNIKKINNYYLLPAGKYEVVVKNKTSNDAIDYVKIKEINYNDNILTADFDATISNHQDSPYLAALFNVETPGIYNINTEDGSNCFTIIDATSLSEIANLVGKKVYFEKGSYIVYYHAGTPINSKIKYIFEVYNALEEITVELKNYNDFNLTPELDDYVINIKVKSDQIVKYWFELIEDCNIFFDAKIITLYDSNGKQLTINENLLKNKTVIKLEKGRYYFTSNKINSETLNLPIFKTTYNDANVFLSEMVTVIPYESTTFKVYECEKIASYFILTIPSDGEYTTSTINMFDMIYDENFNNVEYHIKKHIPTGNYEGTIYLKKGMYYVSFFKSDVSKTSSFYIKKN